MTAITGSKYFRPSDLIALRCDDLSIRILDTETKKLVRELWGCTGQISDFVRPYLASVVSVLADRFGSVSPMTAAGSLLHLWILSYAFGTYPQDT